MLIRERETTQRWSSWKWNNSPGVLRLFSKILILGMKVRHSVWLIPPRLTLGQSIYIHNWKDKKWNLIFGQIEYFSPEPHQLLTQRAKPITSGEKILEQVISGSTSRMTATPSNTPTSPSSSMVDTCSPQFPSILDYKDRYRPLPQVILHIFWTGCYPLDRAIYRRYMALAKFGNVFMCSMLHCCITKIYVYIYI